MPEKHLAFATACYSLDSTGGLMAIPRDRCPQGSTHCRRSRRRNGSAAGSGSRVQVLSSRVNDPSTNITVTSSLKLRVNLEIS